MSSADYPLAPDPALEWTGAKRNYDLVKEFVIALLAVALLTVLFAALFSSPDAKPVTIAGWANAAPHDFVATALTELDGTSGTAGYGPPYTHVKGASQNTSAGVYTEGAQEYVLEAIGRVRNVEEIGDTVIAMRGGRSVLVRLRDHGAPGSALHAGRPGARARVRPHRDPQPVQWKPAASPGVREHPASRGRRARQRGHDHRQHFLHRRVSRHNGRHDRSRAGYFRRVRAAKSPNVTSVS